MEYLMFSHSVLGEGDGGMCLFFLIFIIVLEGREYLLHFRDNKSEASSEKFCSFPKYTQYCPGLTSIHLATKSYLSRGTMISKTVWLKSFYSFPTLSIFFSPDMYL